jgi:hypothetical protein
VADAGRSFSIPRTIAAWVSSIGRGSYVEPSKVTVAELLTERLAQWQAYGRITARTAERYVELIANQINPYLGSVVLQRLKPIAIEQWHNTLSSSGSHLEASAMRTDLLSVA